MAHTDTFQDEILYCANCGISFLWAQEEQKQAGKGKAPRLCPGCRLLAPVAPRLRGVVKWYHPRKQYGFIARKGESELYVHGSALLAVPHAAPWRSGRISHCRNRTRPGSGRSRSPGTAHADNRLTTSVLHSGISESSCLNTTVS